MRANSKILHFATEITLLIGLLAIGSVASFGQRKNSETIDATAFGTSTQLGRTFGVKLIIYEFSGPEDRDRDKSDGVLVPAAQLIVNKEGELQWELNQNSWRLTNILEWD